MKRMLLVALLALAAGPARAGLDWTAGISLSDGDRTFVNLSVGHFDADPVVVTPVLRRLPHPEENLPVLLFLARESGRAPDYILDLRLRGLSWWDITLRLGVPPSRVYYAVPADPGPPYGKAWGYWRKHPHARKGTVIINDREFCDIVGAQVVGKAYGVSPRSVLDERRAGKRYGGVVDRHEKARHGKGGSVSTASAGGKKGQKNSGKGNGNNQGNGNGKSKGKGRG